MLDTVEARSARVRVDYEWAKYIGIAVTREKLLDIFASDTSTGTVLYVPRD